MKRYDKGRFTKESTAYSGYEFKINLPPFKTFIFILLLILILLPWAIIISRFKLFEKLFKFFDDLMTQREEDSQKENGLFY